MYQLILVVHILICVSLIALVLIQNGKGAEVGAAFGSGASQTLFGSQGTGSFLMKLTGYLALAFFGTCLLLGALAAKDYKKSFTLNVPSVSKEVQAVSASPAPDSKKESSNAQKS